MPIAVFSGDVLLLIWGLSWWALSYSPFNVVGRLMDLRPVTTLANVRRLQEWKYFEWEGAQRCNMALLHAVPNVALVEAPTSMQQSQRGLLYPHLHDRSA